MTIFAPKCSAEIAVYYSQFKMCKWVKYSLVYSLKWLHVSRYAVALIDTHVSHPADKCSWFHWTVKTGRLTQRDLNPVDYSIWGALQQLVNRQKFKNIDHLKQNLNSWWVMISQKLINNAVEQWSKRLLLVVRLQVGHIEYRFH